MNDEMRWIPSDPDLAAAYAMQQPEPSNEFADTMGDMLRGLISNGFSRDVAEQIVLVSIKHSLGVR